VVILVFCFIVSKDERRFLCCIMSCVEACVYILSFITVIVVIIISQHLVTMVVCALQAANKKQKYERISEKKMSTPVEVLCKVNMLCIFNNINIKT